MSDYVGYNPANLPLVEYPFTQEIAKDLLEVYNIDAYALHDYQPFKSLRVLKPNAVHTTDYNEERVNVLATLNNHIIDIYRG